MSTVRLWPTDINDFGQIVGQGEINGEPHGFLLTPIPEPNAQLLLLIGSGTVVAIWRFRRRVE
jgi:hypothetical protein